jgi:predicted Zn-dependent protease
MRAGDPARAVAYLRRAVELNPKGSMVNEYLGRAYLEAGYPDEAIAALEREVAVAPSRYDPHIYLDPICAACGNREKAAYHRDQANYNNPGRLILGPAAVQEVERHVRTPKTVPIPTVFEPQP